MRTLVIAEAGVNHNGNIDLAKKLIDVAKEAGADIVKFQTAKVDSLVSDSAEMADYQRKHPYPLTEHEHLKLYLKHFY